MHDATPKKRNKKSSSEKSIDSEEAGLLNNTNSDPLNLHTKHYDTLVLPQDLPSKSSLSHDGYVRSPSDPNDTYEIQSSRKSRKKSNEQVQSSSSSGKNAPLHLILLYSLINTIMCVPCLYGYTSVIFNNVAFQPHINALSKLVLFSSIIHQASFTMFSSLPFAIGQVQDAGLIFLSQMANSMANSMIAEGASDVEIVSTTIVVLGVATSLLGVVLVLMGKFRLADLVSYLPLPVVGGYLAFIGYFCLEAGISLCISKSIVVFHDWHYLLDPKLLLLALPGIFGGLLIALASRSKASEAALPLTMMILPIAFYMIVCLVPAYDFAVAREHGWLGPTSEPIPAKDVFAMIHLDKVQWEVAWQCFPTWLGMVFVVAFSSCLDVAAISMDMGEALDVNNELKTVGASNVISGLLGGFTGSYIFSSTIFTYRTGVRSRKLGIILMVAEVAVFLMTTNVLEIVPLFFLGASLTFIGFDLLYEWVIEVRHKLLLSEYCILLATFGSIHIIGIDGGILFGILIAVLDYVIVTAKASTLTRVNKRSRAVWNHKEWQYLEKHAYDEENPKIITFEIIGNVFFGSSLQLLNCITHDLHIVATISDRQDIADAMISPMHRPSPHSTPKSTRLCVVKQRAKSADFLVLDMSQMQNLDVSSARGCFLQLTKMCSKRGIVICASGASPRIDWILRSHGIACNDTEEQDIKQKLRGDQSISAALQETPMIIMFETVVEALEFCESCTIVRMAANGILPGIRRSLSASALFSLEPRRYSLSAVFREYLGLDERDTILFERYENVVEAVHHEIIMESGEKIFSIGEEPDAFYIVLAGSIILHRKTEVKSLMTQTVSNGSDQQLSKYEQNIVTGGGLLTHSTRKHAVAGDSDDLGEDRKYLKLGSLFGFVDYILEKNRTFGAVAKENGTVIAKIHRDRLDSLKVESPELQILVDKLLLQASIRELAANATDF